ncbi:signal recognition particle-docking protein FtsY [Methylobrevis pamukkalensis]|uniref:Signal recognition particle receptor FtsY n=1 Tax=Methylobrevis pamukkalensis TaxID=1439726 RepID=A0A1E3GZ26_9HYPH|nr:signal recognition particle-docking protein FtsY [Methylobrevis pamukkalensis]ODN69185.1 Signal recognition particle receptor FtsY [Methylobrevis pamukkalensis]
MTEDKKSGFFRKLQDFMVAKPAPSPEPEPIEERRPAPKPEPKPEAKPVPEPAAPAVPELAPSLAAPAPVPARDLLPPAPEPEPAPESPVAERAPESAPGPAPAAPFVAPAPVMPAPPPVVVAPVAVAPPAPITEPVAAEPARKLSWFQRLKSGLARSSSAIGEGITSIFLKRKLDDDTLEELENVLIQADLGVATATAITEALAKGRYGKDIAPDEVKAILSSEVAKVLAPVAAPLVIDAAKRPFVLLVVGVNGSGKTTTIGKLAAKFRAEGRSVMMAAGDTFRAAAIEQLKVWGARTGTPVVAREVGSDAAGLAFDAVKAAQETGTDVLLVDTAGRLQNKAELMAELEKVIRVIRKVDPTAPHATLLVLDATTGQNALNQVEVFGRTAGVTGLVMTKLDGTARGGILVAISAKFRLPVHFIGVGEGIDDLEPFRAEDFAKAIAGV